MLHIKRIENRSRKLYKWEEKIMRKFIEKNKYNLDVSELRERDGIIYAGDWRHPYFFKPRDLIVQEIENLEGGDLND
jgi:hypothetical protein